MTSQPADERCLLPTRVPAALRSYLKQYAKHHGLSMEAFLADVLMHFVTLRPDQRGLRWRTPQSNRTEAAKGEAWAQVNLWVSNDLAAQLTSLASSAGQSKASVLYTALFWFARFMRPPVAALLTVATTSANQSTAFVATKR